MKVIGEAILETSSIILDNSISNETADEVYSLIEDLEAALLCVSICGEEAVILEVFLFFFLIYIDNICFVVLIWDVLRVDR